MHLPRIRPLLHWVMIAVLALQMLVPVGFMPDFQAFRVGQVRLTICSGHETRNITVNTQTDNEGSPKAQHVPASHGICSFAFAHAPLVPVAVISLLALALFILAFARACTPEISYFETRITAWPRGPPFVLN